ncbi:MAG: hypothetical protein ACI92W_003120, partial [Paraglaciecola sp.]
HKPTFFTLSKQLLDSFPLKADAKIQTNFLPKQITKERF